MLYLIQGHTKKYPTHHPHCLQKYVSLFEMVLLHLTSFASFLYHKNKGYEILFKITAYRKKEINCINLIFFPKC